MSWLNALSFVMSALAGYVTGLVLIPRWLMSPSEDELSSE